MSDGAFHAPEERVHRLSDLIVSTLGDPERPWRVLDIGCGAGDQIFDLAPRLPSATFTGVDIAPRNIALALERSAGGGAADRFTFRTEDYRTVRAGVPFDVLLSYSVFQFIPAAVADLARRLGEDATPDALFFNVMPCRSGYNRLLNTVRRLLRAVRTPLSDRVLRRVAHALHGHALSAEMLEERLGYAYQTVEHYEDDLAEALAAVGFRTLLEQRVPPASPAQLRHRLRVMKRG